jgi:hypothetical protein
MFLLIENIMQKMCVVLSSSYAFIFLNTQERHSEGLLKVLSKCLEFGLLEVKILRIWCLFEFQVLDASHDDALSGYSR